MSSWCGTADGARSVAHGYTTASLKGIGRYAIGVCDGTTDKGTGRGVIVVIEDDAL